MVYDKDEVMIGSAQAAKILGTTQGHLRSLARENKIPSYKFIGRWKYKISEIEAFSRANLKSQSVDKKLTGAHRDESNGDVQ